MRAGISSERSSSRRSGMGVSLPSPRGGGSARERRGGVFYSFGAQCAFLAFDRQTNCAQDGVHVGYYIVVGEADNPISLVLQPLAPQTILFVPRRLVMD